MTTSSPAPTLDPAWCAERQRRLQAILAARQLDAAVIADNREIYYFTGIWLDRAPACLVFTADGRRWLAAREATAADPAAQAVDEIVPYEWHKLFTMNPDPARRMAAAVASQARRMPELKHIGWQSEAVLRAASAALKDAWSPIAWVAIDDDLAVLQSRKDPDELALIRRSIQADLAAYDAARAAIAPGVSELEVLTAAQRAATLSAGESVFHNGDYACGAAGGSARDRRIEPGELYIVDAWTIYRGYWSDLSRAFSVDGRPTELQQSLFDHIAAIQRQVAALLKPGLKGTDLWRWMDARIREHPALAGGSLTHHAGHGVGLRAHEPPDLNRDREGVLQAGNVVSVEPGGYADAARAGVRLENMYLITDSGAELLSDYPMGM